MSIPVVDDFMALIASLISGNRELSKAETFMHTAADKQEVERIYNALPKELQEDTELKREYAYLVSVKPDGEDQASLLENLLTGSLNTWLDTIKKYEASDPAQAKENLIKLSADVMTLAASSAAVDYTLGTVPTASLGPASAANTKQILTWLGVGAVVTAVAHDPVKIGLLRPYQDSLEQTFRNRRPDSGDLFLAYQQRSLSSTKIEDVNAITDTLMTQIENENEKFYDTEISKWGYSELFSNALKDSSTKTLSFGNLMALAKQGRLNRGMATYSLWGYGLDRRLMKIALEALDQANEIANYEGFRAQIEPAYVEGDIDEASLLDYWKKLHIPADVQGLMLPRFQKRRAAFALKQNPGATSIERDLTVSQIQQGYQNLLMDRGTAQNQIITLGYSWDEAQVLLDIAEQRRKLPAAQVLKRLTLSDYEKAAKAGLITNRDVLDRMKGEYTEYDISLEKKLLEAGKA
jgi:hypothetical protein